MKYLILVSLIMPTAAWAGCTTVIDARTGYPVQHCVPDNPDGSTRQPRCTTSIDMRTGYPVEHCY
jgi:hypothetical protein